MKKILALFLFSIFVTSQSYAMLDIEDQSEQLKLNAANTELNKEIGLIRQFLNQPCWMHHNNNSFFVCTRDMCPLLYAIITGTCKKSGCQLPKTINFFSAPKEYSMVFCSMLFVRFDCNSADDFSLYICDELVSGLFSPRSNNLLNCDEFCATLEHEFKHIIEGHLLKQKCWDECKDRFEKIQKTVTLVFGLLAYAGGVYASSFFIDLSAIHLRPKFVLADASTDFLENVQNINLWISCTVGAITRALSFLAFNGIKKLTENVYFSWCRLQEKEADLTVSNPKALASALKKLSLTTKEIDDPTHPEMQERIQYLEQSALIKKT